MTSINQILNTTRTGRNGRELTLTITDDGFTMAGGEYGSHTLAIAHTSDARLIAHWDGYCRENGWRPVMTQAEMRKRWEHEARTGERLCEIGMGGSAASWAKHLKGRY